jgi:hypothetical protein
MSNLKDTSSKEYVKWMANVWRCNHLQNQPIAETEKAKVVVPSSK